MYPDRVSDNFSAASEVSFAADERLFAALFTDWVVLSVEELVEVLEEFVASANGNQELLKDEDALKDLAEKYCYIAEIREDEETGEIIYLIENNVNPDEEYTTQKYILDMSTLTLEYDPQI